MLGAEGVDLKMVIASISKHIGQDWKSLGRAFRFTKTDIDAIQLNDVCNLKEQIAQLFIKWEMQEGLAATPQALVDALIENQLNQVIQALKQEGLLQRKGIFLNLCIYVLSFIYVCAFFLRLG